MTTDNGTPICNRKKKKEKKSYEAIFYPKWEAIRVLFHFYFYVYGMLFN